MSLLIKNASLYIAIIITGLSAGFFYAWQVSVIPGTKQVSDRTFLEVMQSINRAILNPWFFVIFMGSLLVLFVALIAQYGQPSFFPVLAALVFYLFGTMGVTIMGNVPLNDTLDVINLSIQDEYALKEIRTLWEPRWNRFHLIRTVCSVLSFLMVLLAAFTTIKNQ